MEIVAQLTCANFSPRNLGQALLRCRVGLPLNSCCVGGCNIRIQLTSNLPTVWCKSSNNGNHNKSVGLNRCQILYLVSLLRPCEQKDPKICSRYRTVPPGAHRAPTLRASRAFPMYQLWHFLCKIPYNVLYSPASGMRRHCKVRSHHCIQLSEETFPQSNDSWTVGGIARIIL